MGTSPGEALVWASGKGQSEVVRHILKECQSNREVVNFRPIFGGMTALHSACRNGHAEVIDLLLSNGAEIESTNGPGFWTPLTEASVRGKPSAIEVLLRHGADIEAKVRYPYEPGRNNFSPGSTALILASELGQTEAMEVLLRNGAKIDAQADNGDTSLVRAITNRRIGAVEVLMRYGAPVDSTIIISALDTRLIRALRKWDTNAIRVWLRRHRNSNYRHHQQETLLHWAARNKEYHFMSLLLQNGGVKVVDARSGKKAGRWVRRKGRLIRDDERRARVVYATEESGGEITPLALAASLGDAQAVQILLNHGASVHLQDQNGYSPLDHALVFSYDHEGNQPESLRTIHLLVKALYVHKR